jgi:hypothetical protein
MTELEKPETVGGMMGRIATGIALMVLGGAFAIVCVVLFVRGVLNPDTADWVDLLGDVVGVAAFLGLAVAITGFELVRRGRRARNAIVPSVLDTAASFTVEPRAEDAAHTNYVAPPPPKPLV